MTDADEDLDRPRLPFPPAVLAMMSTYRRRRLQEVEERIVDEEEPAMLEWLAAEHGRIEGLLARMQAKARTRGPCRPRRLQPWCAPFGSEAPRVEVVPHAHAKRFADCEPGELIRTPFRGKVCLALTTARGEQRYLIFFTGEHLGSLFQATPQVDLPRYLPIEADQLDAVLSYGRDFTVQVDHDGPLDIGGVSDLWGKNGTVSVSDSSWLLRALPFQGFTAGGGMYCDLSSGAVVNEPRHNATFGKWAIYPQQPQGSVCRFPPLYTFSAV